MFYRSLVIFFFLLFSASLYASDNSYWLENLHLWDGSQFSSETQSVLVEDGLIKDIKNTTSQQKSSNPTYRYDKAFLLPGLINAHVHLINPNSCEAGKGFELATVFKNLSDFLKSGFTTVADMGGWPELLVTYRNYIKNNPQFGPTIMMAGPILTLPEAYPDNWMPPMARFVGAVRYIEEEDLFDDLLDYDVDYLKIGLQEKSYANKKLPFVSETQIQSFIKKAHQNNLRLFAHTITEASYDLALKGQVDAFLHGPHELLKDEVIQEIASNQTALIPTIWMWKSMWSLPEEGHPKLDEWKTKLLEGEYQNWESYLADYNKSENFPAALLHEEGIPKISSRRAYFNLVQNLQKMKSAGVKFVFGSDAPYCFNTSFNGLQEMKELEKIGFSRSEILNMATRKAAHFLKKEKEIGSITVGKRADFVILKSNPLESLNAFEDLESVIHQGEFVNLDKKVGLFDKFKALLFLIKSFFQSLV